MAARTEQRRFGSYDLTDANGITLEQWPSRLSLDVETRPRVQGDGSVLVQRRAVGQQFQVAGVVTGADTGVVRDRLDALYAALYSGEDFLQLYSDRRVRCALHDFRHERRSGAPHVVDWSATFIARWPLWESPTVTQSTSSISGAGPNQIVLPSNSGTAPTWPLIRVTNTAGGSIGPIVLSVASINSTRTIQFGGLSLLSGQQIVVDMREGRIGDGVGTPVRPAFIDGRFWPLAAGVNTIEVAHNIGAGASLDVVVSWYPAFWML